MDCHLRVPSTRLFLPKHLSASLAGLYSQHTPITYSLLRNKASKQEHLIVLATGKGLPWLQLAHSRLALLIAKKSLVFGASLHFPLVLPAGVLDPQGATPSSAFIQMQPLNQAGCLLLKGQDTCYTPPPITPRKRKPHAPHL